MVSKKLMSFAAVGALLVASGCSQGHMHEDLSAEIAAVRAIAEGADAKATAAQADAAAAASAASAAADEARLAGEKADRIFREGLRK